MPPLKLRRTSVAFCLEPDARGVRARRVSEQPYRITDQPRVALLAWESCGLSGRCLGFPRWLGSSPRASLGPWRVAAGFLLTGVLTLLNAY